MRDRPSPRQRTIGGADVAPCERIRGIAARGSLALYAFGAKHNHKPKPKPPIGDADHSPPLARAPIINHAGLASARVEAILEPVQIAEVAQDFADIFSAALPCAAVLHLDKPLSRRLDRDSTAR